MGKCRTVKIVCLLFWSDSLFLFLGRKMLLKKWELHHFKLLALSVSNYDDYDLKNDLKVCPVHNARKGLLKSLLMWLWTIVYTQLMCGFWQCRKLESVQKAESHYVIRSQSYDMHHHLHGGPEFDWSHLL